MPNLDNGLKAFYLDGKAVRKASLDGKVFFEKHNYDLSLTADKSVFQVGDTSTLTATLTDYNEPIEGETVLMYDSDNVSLATYYNWLDVFLCIVTSENKGEIIFDTTNAEHNMFYIEDTASGGGYSNGGRVKFVITDTQVETWRYNSSKDTWTKSMMLYNLPVKIGFSYGTEIISDTAKIPFFAMGITDSQGQCSVGYVGKGTGDLNIKCECMNLQETCVIQDYWYINTNVYTTSSVTLNVPLPPSFQLEYDSTPTTRSWSNPYLDIGASSNNRMLVGQYARNGANGIITYSSRNDIYTHPNLTVLNQINKIKFIYMGDNYSYSLNDVLMTVANQNITLDKIIHIESGDGGRLTNIKVIKL